MDDDRIQDGHETMLEAERTLSTTDECDQDAWDAVNEAEDEYRKSNSSSDMSSASEYRQVRQRTSILGYYHRVPEITSCGSAKPAIGSLFGGPMQQVTPDELSTRRSLPHSYLVPAKGVLRIEPDMDGKYPSLDRYDHSRPSKPLKKRTFYSMYGPGSDEEAMEKKRCVQLGGKTLLIRAIVHEPVIITIHDEHDCIIRVVELLEDDGAVIEYTTHFLVDRTTIAAASPFLRTMLTSHKWTGLGGYVVDFTDVEASVMNVLLCIAAGFFDSTTEFYRQYQRSFNTTKDAIRQACFLPTEDGSQVLAKAQEYLLEEKHVHLWLHRWTWSSSARAERDIAIGYSYHTDRAGMFQKYTYAQMCMSPLNQPIRSIFTDSRQHFVAPRFVFEHLDKIRQNMALPFLMAIRNIHLAEEKRSIHIPSSFLEEAGLKLIGQELEVGDVSMMRLKLIDVHYRRYVGDNRRFLTRKELAAKGKGFSDTHSKLERAGDFLMESVSTVCLDCLSKSAKLAGEGVDAWKDWIQLPFGKICRVQHDEATFRSSYLGFHMHADAILRARHGYHGISWEEEGKRFGYVRKPGAPWSLVTDVVLE